MEEGEYLIQDLMGLKVVDVDDGHLYGELTQVSPTGANDVYHIRFADGKERLIPAIPQVVLEVDLDGGVMKIRCLLYTSRCVSETGRGVCKGNPLGKRAIAVQLVQKQRKERVFHSKLFETV